MRKLEIINKETASFSRELFFILTDKELEREMKRKNFAFLSNKSIPMTFFFPI
jgi:hypothetical protein